MCLSRKLFLVFLILLFSLSVLGASKLVLFRTKTESEDSDAFKYGVSYINVESEYFHFCASYDLYSDSYYPMINIAVSLKVFYGSNDSSLSLIKIEPSKDSTKEYIEERIIEQS